MIGARDKNYFEFWPGVCGVTRRFSKLSDYVAEVVNARVYDGVHYRTSRA